MTLTENRVLASLGDLSIYDHPDRTCLTWGGGWGGFLPPVPIVHILKCVTHTKLQDFWETLGLER